MSAFLDKCGLSAGLYGGGIKGKINKFLLVSAFLNLSFSLYFPIRKGLGLSIKMHIHHPEMAIEFGEVVYSAIITLDTPGLNLPNRLIYRFPLEYQLFLNSRSDAFVAAMLPLAMHLGEDITCTGELSERLYYGMGEVIKIFSKWLPDVYQSIQIHADTLIPSIYQPEGKTLAAFSGGVDSSFVLYNHLPPIQNNPTLQVTHCAFIQGFDIPLQEDIEYNAWYSIFQKNLSDLGVEVIAVKTNAQYFTTGQVKWEYAHGCALASVGLMLEPMFKQYLIASSWLMTMLRPWGSSIVIDHWFSTEKMAVRHSGVEAGRFEEMKTISRWIPSQEMLRVCTNYKHRQPGINCSACEKCKRTMAMLMILDAPNGFRTFSRTLTPLELLQWVPGYEIYAPAMIRFCWQEKKLSYIPILLICQARYLLRRFIRRFIPRWLFTQLKSHYYPLDKNPFYADNLPIEWR